MVILAEGEPIRRVIISRFGKRHEVRGIYESKIMLRQPNPQAAGDALIIVEFDDSPTKGGGATWQFIFDCILRDRRPDISQIYPRLHEMHGQLRSGVGKIPGDERIAKPRSENLISDKHLPAIDESREDTPGV